MPHSKPAPERPRPRLGHPVVDADGHIVEALPLLTDVIRKVAGPDAADHFLGSSPAYASRSADRRLTALTGDQRRLGTWITPWWSLPGDTLDRATAFLPSLLHERMDEIGLDFTVLYPSVGLIAAGHPDAAIRTGACRGVNTYLADLTDGLHDRMTAAAVIPTHTPDEAIAELEHAVTRLGYRAVLVNNIVARPVPGGPDGAVWYDVLALDSAYDYDPLWRRCAELGVAVTVHAPTMGIGLRQSSTRYVHNHIGTFAAGGEAFAKALVIGGVAHRFPTLNFAFLEGGVSWGVQLLADLIGHWEKRGGPNIRTLDPAGLAPDLWHNLFARHASPAPNSSPNCAARPTTRRPTWTTTAAAASPHLPTSRACSIASTSAAKPTTRPSPGRSPTPSTRAAPYCARCSARTSATGTSPTCAKSSARPTNSSTTGTWTPRSSATSRATTPSGCTAA
ncbi:MAG: amidohydrolase family protein [Streptomycetaceae bacterium]|nr:amidohydrolase family protein [Streptomycetaceae bacterium]